MRTVFNYVAELEHVCLISPNVAVLDPALEQIFGPLTRRTDPGPRCLALICHRDKHSPRLSLRLARVEDHDDILPVVEEQSNLLSLTERPYFIVDIIESLDRHHLVAVCEDEGVIVGFIAATGSIDTRRLCGCYDVSGFRGLDPEEDAPQSGEEDPRTDTPPQVSAC
ncbi:cilia- and flagella-associated protein 61-like [Menidia menidia]